MKKYLIFLFFLFAHFLSHAEHLVGGQIYYDCFEIGPDYRELVISLDVFRENGPTGGADFDNPVTLGVYVLNTDGSYSYLRSIEALLLERTSVRNGADTLFNLDSTIPYEVEIGRFETPKVRLPLDLTLMIAMQRCCREQAPINGPEIQEGMALVTTLFPNTDGLCNSSPRMLNIASFLGLLTESNEMDLGVFDPDGDELTFAWTAPLVAGGLSGSGNPGTGGNTDDCDGIIPDVSECLPPFADFNFADGYAFDKPFGLDVTTTLDSNTGFITTTLEEEGNYWYAILISESRAGTNLGEMIADLSMQGFSLEDFSLITGTRFVDFNENQIFDIGDVPTNNIFFDITPTPEYLEFSSSSAYTIAGQPGTYEISLDNELWELSAANDPLPITINSQGTLQDLDIGFKSKKDTVILEPVDLEVLFRCNGYVFLGLGLFNAGTAMAQVEYIVDVNGLEIGYVDFDAEMIDNSTYKFIFNIPPQSSALASFYIDTPDETHLGELYPIDVSYNYNPTGFNCCIATDDYVVEKELVCSYDPNDKIGKPGEGPDNIIDPDQEISYTIRFENLGNIAARDVRIVDTLDVNLDISTFKIVYSQRSFRLRMLSENILEFNFRNINLQPSTEDFPIIAELQYKITPVANIEPGTVIENRAGIYFDNNPPIITNTTSHKIRELIKTASFPVSGVCLFPNPVSELFYIMFDEQHLNQNFELTIQDMVGKLITRRSVESLLEFKRNGIPSGTYFYSLKDEEGKILVQDKFILY